LFRTAETVLAVNPTRCATDFSVGAGVSLPSAFLLTAFISPDLSVKLRSSLPPRFFSLGPETDCIAEKPRQTEKSGTFRNIDIFLLTTDYARA
jgi:hypothetical protein